MQCSKTALCKGQGSTQAGQPERRGGRQGGPGDSSKRACRRASLAPCCPAPDAPIAVLVHVPEQRLCRGVGAAAVAAAACAAAGRDLAAGGAGQRRRCCCRPLQHSVGHRLELQRLPRVQPTLVRAVRCLAALGTVVHGCGGESGEVQSARHHVHRQAGRQAAVPRTATCWALAAAAQGPPPLACACMHALLLPQPSPARRSPWVRIWSSRVVWLRAGGASPPPLLPAQPAWLAPSVALRTRTVECRDW